MNPELVAEATGAARFRKRPPQPGTRVSVARCGGCASRVVLKLAAVSHEEPGSGRPSRTCKHEETRGQARQAPALVACLQTNGIKRGNKAASCCTFRMAWSELFARLSRCRCTSQTGSLCRPLAAFGCTSTQEGSAHVQPVSFGISSAIHFFPEAYQNRVPTSSAAAAGTHCLPKLEEGNQNHEARPAQVC
jgi:hypothetical protein